MDPVDTGFSYLLKKTLIKIGISSSVIGWAWLARDVAKLYPDMRDYYEKIYHPAEKEVKLWSDATRELAQAKHSIDIFRAYSILDKEDLSSKLDAASDKIAPINAYLTTGGDYISETQYHTEHPEMKDTIDGLARRVNGWDAKTQEDEIRRAYEETDQLLDEATGIREVMRKSYRAAGREFEDRATKFNFKLLGTTVLTAINGLMLGKAMRKR